MRTLKLDARIGISVVAALIARFLVVQHGKLREWSEGQNQLDRFAAAFPEDRRIERLRQGLP